MQVILRTLWRSAVTAGLGRKKTVTIDHACCFHASTQHGLLRFCWNMLLRLTLLRSVLLLHKLLEAELVANSSSLECALELAGAGATYEDTEVLR